MKPLVITHKNCVDGCCCKAIFRKKFGDKADYLELDHVNLDVEKDPDAPKYVDKILSMKNSQVYVSDFCLQTDMIETLLEQNNKVVILDHHATSIPFIEPFEKRIADGEKLNLDIHFAKDNHCSGAMLTWQYLYPDIEPPLAVKYVSDGDIWKFEYGEDTKYFYTGLLDKHNDPSTIPDTTWDSLVADEKTVENMVNIGRPIRAKYMEEVMSFTIQARSVKLDGKEGFMVIAPKKYTSELGNELSKMSGGFGLVYYIEDNGVVRCSLRSVAPYTVNDIAKKFGGGGHAQASAFRCKNQDEFISLLKQEGNNIHLGLKPRF